MRLRVPVLTMRFATLLVAAGLGSAPAVALAAKPARLAVAFDIAEDQSPEYVCFVTSTPCGNDPSCSGERELEPMIGKVLKRLERDATSSRFVFDAATITNDQKITLGPAIHALKRHTSVACAGEHEQCQPEIVRPVDPRKPDKHHYMQCGQNDLPTGSSRVAFVDIAFDSDASGAGVKLVRLTGTVATVYFNAPITSSYLFGRVLGGDYVDSREAAIGTRERLNLTLHPRCLPYAVQLPPRAPSVRIQPNGVHFQIGGRDTACDAGDPGGARSSFTAMIPYRDDQREKMITVLTSSDLSNATGELEAAWVTAAPPRPVQLGYRSTSVVWTRHCLMPRSDEDADGETASPGQLPIGSCPDVALVAAGSQCTLDRQTDAACHYICRAPQTMPAFALPSPVVFSRRLHKQAPGESAVESWNDELRYSGQILASYVAADLRQLQVVYGDPQDWRSVPGDRIEAIEFVTPRLEKRRIAKGGERVSIPGVRCNESIVYRVVGSRSYAASEQQIASGRIVLRPPGEMAESLRFGWFLGGGIDTSLESKTLPFSSMGGFVSLAMRTELWGVRLVFAEPGIGVRLTFRPHEIAASQIGGQKRESWIWYNQGIASIALGAAFEPGNYDMRFGVALSAALGNPVWKENNVLIGRYDFTYQPSLFARLHIRSWSMVALEAHVGMTIDERVYKHDFCVHEFPDGIPTGDACEVGYDKPRFLGELRLRFGP